MLEVFRILIQRGFEVEAGICEEILLRPDRIRAAHDLYVLKSSELSFCVGGMLHVQGARLLNPYPSCLAVQNKVVTCWLLRDAGIPTPDSWATIDLELARSLVQERPVIIKPYLGNRGTGISIVRRPDDLDVVPMPKCPVIVQEYVEGGGEDLKLYVVGEEVFATRRRFGEFSLTGPPCSASEELRELGRRCGQALGLGLYGVDVIEGPHGPVVVDVNQFPSYTGIPDVERLIASYIEGYAHGDHTLEPPALLGQPTFEQAADRADLATSPATLSRALSPLPVANLDQGSRPKAPASTS